MTTSVGRTALAAAMAIGLVAAGCGDGDGGTDASPGTSAPAAAVALDGPGTEQLQAVVDEVVAEVGAPGAVVAVTTPEGSWDTVVGTADLDGGTPLRRGLTWPLRSITKSFTVTLVLQLADEGSVDLDEPVATYVAGVPGGDEVTLRQLAAMTSGLPDYTTEAFLDDFVDDPTRVFTDDELLAYAWAEPPRAAPGDERVYTNSNTILLGRVVEEVTGEPFAEVLDQRLLEPLGLDGTTYPVDDPAAWDTGVVGYAPDDDGGLVDQPVNQSVFGPAGAALATVDDLLAWGPVLAEGTVVSEEAHAERLVAAPLEEGPEYDAYGLGIGELDGWWGHTGEGFGFTSLVMHDEATGTTVAIVMNASQLESHGPTTLFRRLAPLLVG